MKCRRLWRGRRACAGLNSWSRGRCGRAAWRRRRILRGRRFRRWLRRGGRVCMPLLIITETIGIVIWLKTISLRGKIEEIFCGWKRFRFPKWLWWLETKKLSSQQVVRIVVPLVSNATKSNAVVPDVRLCSKCFKWSKTYSLDYSVPEPLSGVLTSTCESLPLKNDYECFTHIEP